VSVVPVADPDRRVQAFAIDRLVGWGIDAAVTIAVGRLLWPHGHHLLGVLVVLVTVLVVLLVFSVLLGITGVTPGKALRGLRLVHTGTGEPIGVGPAVLRTAVLGLAAVPFGFGLAALAWTAVADTTGLRRGWHDHLVSSVELDAKPLPRSAAVSDPGPPPVVNLTTARLLPAPARDPGD
jgi:RDD family